VSLRVIAESVSAKSKGLRFRCDRDGHPVDCGIADAALRELVDFHRFNGSEDRALQAVLAELERITNAKCEAGRFEENGCLVIRPVDLLRYGYHGRDRSAA
jgi:hypothetical protein